MIISLRGEALKWKKRLFFKMVWPSLDWFPNPLAPRWGPCLDRPSSTAAGDSPTVHWDSNFADFVLRVKKDTSLILNRPLKHLQQTYIFSLSVHPQTWEPILIFLLCALHSPSEAPWHFPPFLYSQSHSSWENDLPASAHFVPTIWLFSFQVCKFALTNVVVAPLS